MSADEFSVIRDLFAPHATNEAARALRDDAAVLEASGKLVVTTDTIVEGVHFLAVDPIETVAMKALRVNVSDVIAKGARPVAALLNLVWSDARPAAEIATFAEAFGRDLKLFGVNLIGGDTTSTPGPLTISVTLLGEPLGSRVPARGDAQVGEDVWLIGGEIGSAWLGLQLRKGEIGLARLREGRDEVQAQADSRALSQSMPDYLKLANEDFDAEAAWLMTAYLAPFVRPECASVISKFASASMDVSDGLVTDAGKIADASGVALRIAINAVPFSIAAERWAFSGGDVRKLITGGDDYVMLFTAPSELRGAIEAAEGSQALRLARIGVVEAGGGVTVVDANGQAIPVADAGYSHKLGR
ncbi:MAG: thiamine-phosphate kinase [Alphaproteobacteria bacterium]|nr:thiamine-phosphate kinase [Alphaproteobacteria bacterium]